MRVLSVYDDRTGSGSSLVLQDGEPDYHELLEEIKKLRLELAEARQQADELRREMLTRIMERNMGGGSHKQRMGDLFTE